MSTLIPRIFRIAIVSSLGLVVLALVAMHVLLGRYDEREALEKLNGNGIRVKKEYIESKDGVVYSVCIGDPGLPKVLLVHGSPGLWVDWIQIITDADMLEHFCFVLYDRPGYGKTTVAVNHNLSYQAVIASTVMEHYSRDNECFTAVGHSYGGAVVEQLLLDHPYRIDRAIFVAGTLSPEAQQPRWYNYLAYATKPLLPDELNASNIEMMALADALHANSGKQGEIFQPLVMIHGTGDVLVPFETVEYYRKVKPQGIEYLLRDGMNHFIPWTDPDLVKEALDNQ